MSILNVDKIQPIGGGSTITVDATDIQATSATITASKFVGSGDLSVTGVSTFTGNIDANGGLDVTGQTTIAHTASPQLILKDSDTSGVGDSNGISLQDSGGTEYGFIGQASTGDHSLHVATKSTTNPVRIQVNGTTRLEAGNSGVYVTGVLDVAAGGDSSLRGDVYIADKIRHIGDDNTAIRFPAADTISFETAGSERLRIDSGGIVTVNHGNPISNGIFKISKDSNGEAQLRFDTASANTASIVLDSAEQLKFKYGGTEVFRIGSDGKVGINSTAPNKLLDVHSTNTNTYSSSASSAPNAGSVIQLTNTSGTDGSGSGYYTGINFAVGYGARSDGYFTYHRTGDNQGDFTFKSRSASNSYPELMRIKSTGRVGIGEASPDTKLHVKYTGDGNSVLKLEPGTTAGNYGGIELGRTDGGGTVRMTTVVKGGVPISGIAGIEFGTSDTSIPAISFASANSSNGHIAFRPKGTEAVRIPATGGIELKTDGKGIQYPMPQTPTSANTARVGISSEMRYYETGTLTPGLSSTVLNSLQNPAFTNASYARRVCRYVRIGHLVHVTAEIQMASSVTYAAGVSDSTAPPCIVGVTPFYYAYNQRYDVSGHPDYYPCSISYSSSGLTNDTLYATLRRDFPAEARIEITKPGSGGSRQYNSTNFGEVFPANAHIIVSCTYAIDTSNADF